jgi:hypothetical protein
MFLSRLCGDFIIQSAAAGALGPVIRFTGHKLSYR